MSVALPSELAAAIAKRLENVSRKALAERAEAMSAGYRKGRTSRAIASEEDVLAYLVARLPATYAAISAVFARLTEVAPDFAPQTLLDVGAGTGAASWAAIAAWPSLGHVTMTDNNPTFQSTAREFATASQNKALAQADFIARDIASENPKADLVVASYVLAELPEDRAAEIARGLWRTTAQMLVLAEPGTPAGFARIRAARAALIADGARVVVPCTHDLKCPMSGDNWCHFSQRLSRSRDHMLAKSANVPFEDERYSYVVLSRELPSRSRARIIAPVHMTRAGIEIPICDSDGALKVENVARRDRDTFAKARRLDWGDAH